MRLARLVAAFAITVGAVSCGPFGPPAAFHSPVPSVTPSPTPLRNQLSLPDSAPVILFHDPADFDQLDGMTWDGTISGRVGVGVASGGLGSPGGLLYATSGDIRNRAGQVVTTYDSKSARIFWADDNRHFCAMARTASRDVSGPGMLQMGVPGQPIKSVTQVGSFGASGSNAGGPTVVSCSPDSDRAVVYQSGGQGVGVQEVWVIQLSTGHISWRRGGGSWIAASHDGQYVALSPAPGSPTTIYGSDGSIAGTTPDEVFMFSWDGSLAVAAGSFGALPRIIDWRSGRAIWTCPKDTFQYWQAFPEPGGSHIAVGALDPAHPQTGGFAPVDLFVVGADGTVVLQRKDVVLFSQ